MTAINGPAWAAWGQGLATYLMGQTPNELTPAVGGDAVPFVHDARVTNADSEINPLIEGELVAYTATPLPVRAVYTYDGQSWTVVEVETDKIGAGVFPCRATLARHAG